MEDSAVPVDDRLNVTVPQSSSEPEVSVLIVAYNSADLIEDCISSILPACKQHHFEVLLIDNGDGSTQDLVQREFPEIRVIDSRGNVGFAAGNNALVEHARADKYLLLNPDMVLEPGSLDRLLDGAKQHVDAAAWGGTTVDEDGRPNSGNAIAMPSLAEFASAALGRSLAGSKTIEGVDEDAEVEVLSGAFVMFSKPAWDEVGGLDDRFFLYCEEVDLFYRLKQRGHKFWRIADVRGYHNAGHGFGNSPMRNLYRTAGTMQFVRQHWSKPSQLATAFLIWLAAFERHLGGELLGKSKPKLRARSRGLRYVVWRPSLWLRGYDKERGLLRKLQERPIKP